MSGYKRKTQVLRMSMEQEGHLKSIKTIFTNLVDTKYRLGQKEHGGNLWGQGKRKLLDCAIDEAIDQVVYLITLKQQLYGIKK